MYNGRTVASTQIHATAVVGDGVELGAGVTVGPGAVLLGPARLGDGCWIGAGCVIGAPPEITSFRQNRAWDGELDHQGVVIGERTVVRELSTVHQGSARPTVIGADCWLLNRVYVAHDCQIGDRVTLSAGTSLGGHVWVGDGANLGMNVSVHQHRIIGPGAMVGMGSPVTRDVPPFGMAFGSPVRLRGVNEVGLTRRKVSESDIRQFATAYESGTLPQPVDEQLLAALRWWADRTPTRSLIN